MTVDLVPAPTDEQAMLQDASARFIAAKFPLASVRERADGAENFDAGYRATAAGLGWFGLLVDAEHGGGSVSGHGLVDAALIAAERGAALQPGPYAGHTVVTSVLPPGDVLTDLVEGRAWATWSPVRAQLRDGRLHGSIGTIAERSDWLLVTTDGATQFLVRADAPGVTFKQRDGLDLTRRWFAVEFDGTPVGVPISGSKLARQMQIAAVLTAAEAVGAMHANLALAVEYAKTRIAFGRPIGSFQAVKHRLAETSLWLQMAKGLVHAAALAADQPNGPELAHAAKSFVGERGPELAQNCFQVFGGIGYTWEHDQHLYLRRLAADAVAFGTPSWHRDQLLAEAL